MRSYGRLVRRVSIALLAAAAFVTVAGAAPVPAPELIFSLRGPYGDVLSVPLDGSAARNLTPGTATSTEYQPSWSPDGARILYASGRADGSVFDIYVADADGSHRQLVTSVAGSGVGPAWSPDGTRIAFVSASASTDVYVTTLGGAVTRLTTDGEMKSVPVWSPDGSEILYTRVTPPDGAATLVTVPAAGGVPRALATQPSGVGAWSPDGTQIAFVRNTPPMPAVYVVGRDGSGLRRISTAPAAAASSVAWSPDGTQVAFTSAEIVSISSRFGALLDYEIAVVAADGRDERKLTRTAPAVFNAEPRWSPDGSRIAFQTSRDGDGRIELYTVNTDGSCETRLTSLARQQQATQHSWRPGTAAPPELRCADLELSTSGVPDSIALEQRMPVRFDIVNSGNEAASDVRFEVTVPPDVQLQSLTTGHGVCDGRTCSLGGLEASTGTSVNAIVSASRAVAAPLVGKAVAPELDGDQHDNALTVRVNVLPCTIVGTLERDIVEGTPKADRICTLTGPDLIHGLGGADSIDAGNGADRVWPGRGRDTIDLKGGVDLVDARDGARDLISCGGEADVALIDRFDKVDKTCEVASRTTLRCETLGSFRANAIVGTARRESICVFAGNDTVDGGVGSDEIDGGTGNDTLTGGPGRDLILAGGGTDLIKARDGSRDIVHCGSELDLVLADRFDVAGVDCERVVGR